MLRSYTKWSTDTECQRRPGPQPHCTKSCWNAGGRTRWKDRHLRLYSGSQKSSLHCRAVNIMKRQVYDRYHIFVCILLLGNMFCTVSLRLNSSRLLWSNFKWPSTNSQTILTFKRKSDKVHLYLSFSLALSQCFLTILSFPIQSFSITKFSVGSQFEAGL